jgi:3-hydroxybutyryl-CoA dehydratase
MVFLDELTVGQTADTARVVGADDIDAFAAVSGDTNPVHVDEAYAKTTSFGGRVAHGMLAASFISAALGTKLPGPGAVYVSQSLKFRRAVKIGDEVTTQVTVKAIDARRGFVTLDTACRVGGKVVVDGEAMVIVQRRGA